MNVLFYYEFLGLGGVESALLNRVAALRGFGVEAHFWHSQFYAEGARYLADNGRARTVQKHEVGLLAAKANFDLIIVVDNPSVLIDVLGKCSGTPTFFETHIGQLWRLHEFYTELQNPRLAGIIVPSEYNRMLIEKTTVNRPERRIFIIKNIVDEELFSPTIEISLRPSAPVMLWVGRLEDPKNPQDLLRIATHMERREPALRFLVIADSWEYEAYLARLKEACTPWPTNVEFIRSVPFDRIAAYYRLAARSGGALLCTSNFESSPMILLEAMLFGCPVVSSAVGGIPLMVEHGKTGLLFSPGDVESAANLIRSITSAPILRADIISRAKEYVRANHSQRVVARELLTLFMSVTAQHPNPDAPVA